MSRALRGLLRGSIALALLYLLVHAREPLRLNVGDSPVHPLLGISDIRALRLVELGCSALAMWMLFAYVRRLYSDRIALIATALWSTSLVWMLYADSSGLMPVITALVFLALWGVLGAIDTDQRRYDAAVFIGSFGAVFTSYDWFIFLPAAVLATIYIKAGNPFARGRRHLVAICVAGCVLAIGAKIGADGWDSFVEYLESELVQRTTSQFTKFSPPIVPTLVRRLTLVFTPFAWITAGYHALKAIRAPSIGAAIKDTAAWMLLAALVFVAVFPQLAGAQMFASHVFLPFYAIGSALVVGRLLDGSKVLRRFAVGWLVAAPLWAFAILVMHPRSFLGTADVAKTSAYLAANDHNDFVLSNLMSAGPLEVAFQRHSMPALDAVDTSDAAIRMMRVFAMTGTDSVHEVIVEGPDSRFVDTALWTLAMPRRKWSITGWPHLHRQQTKALIAEYDRRVMKNLEAVRANELLELSNYAVYRVDRAAVLAQLGKDVPSTSHIDVGSLAGPRHLLLGWKAPHVLPTEQIAVASMEGFQRCNAAHGTPCKTVNSASGLQIEHAPQVFAAQLLIRVDRVCDLALTFSFATDSYLRFSINGFTVTPRGGRTATFTVPAANVPPGLDVIELESLLPPQVGVHLASVDLAPACATP